jgi:hypothetical protein
VRQLAAAPSPPPPLAGIVAFVHATTIVGAAIVGAAMVATGGCSCIADGCGRRRLDNPRRDIL